MRLKVVCEFGCGDGIVFQFQTGAIKRLAETLSLSLDAMFQFQTGAIKSRRRSAPAAGSLFQFQTGAIKSLRCAVDLIAKHAFQFQTGAIKRVLSLPALAGGLAVSIPNWCD